MAKKNEEAAADRKANHERWAKETLNLPSSSPKEPPRGPPDTTANFFKVSFNTAVELHRYTITLGQINGKAPKNRELVRNLIASLLSRLDAEISSKIKYACDYSTTIVSIGRLSDHERKWISHGLGKNGLPIRSLLTYQGPVRVAELISQLQKDNRLQENRQLRFPLEEHLRALNILMWRFIYSDGFQGGRFENTFFPDDASLTGELRRCSRPGEQVYETRTGFFSSVRPGDGSLLLNVNPVTSAFYPFWDLQKFIQARFNSPLPPPNERKYGELIGLGVTFDSDPEKKIRTIAEISDLNIRDQEFYNDKKQKWTVLKYMNETYGAGFDGGVSCVNLGGQDKKSWYPANKLHIVNWQRVKGKVHDDFTKDMLHIATRTPKVNMDLILKFARGPLGISQPQFLHLFGITIDPEPIVLKRNMMPQPKPVYSDNFSVGPEKAHTPASWNIKNVPKLLHPPPRAGDLIIFRIAQTSYPAEASRLQSMASNRLVPALQRYGIKIPSARVVEVLSQPSRAKLSEALTEKHEKSGKYPFVMIFREKKDKTIYPHVKWWADCVAGIACVFFTGTTLSKLEGGDKNLEANICLKVNLKLGGINHRLDSPLGVKDGTLIVGADVTHAGKGLDRGCPSLAGVVASHAPFTDPYSGNFHTYLASSRLQSHNTEFIEDLKGMMMDHLKEYYVSSKQTALPRHILFYRDGVSDSQYGMVLAQEIPQIKEALADAKAICTNIINYNPLVTFVVVGKRHHARFYQREKVGVSARNLPAGTLVDHTVTSPFLSDFYLQSHDSPIGTSRNGHYVLIKNESGYTAEQLKKITNQLCWTGSRATKALSICAPARYADLLCDRLRCYMKPVLDGDLARANPPWKEREVSEYKARSDIWGASSNANWPNPWKETVSRVMFYA